MDGACDFSVGDYDGEPAEVYHESVVTARTPQRCGECGDTIRPGDRYDRSSGKWDGKWSVWRSCLACAEIANEFTDGGRMFGTLWEEMAGNWDEGAPLQPCLNRVSTVRAKVKMRDQWLSAKGIA
jgi:hypothetical protein